MSLASDEQFGHCAIAELICEGGMSRVYRATDTTLDRTVAIKVLPKSFACDSDRFERKAKTLAILNTNIAQVSGLEKQGTTTAIEMELMKGPTLAYRIAQGRIGAEEALQIARQIIDGLDAAHDKGIVHRDKKPTNIKVKPDGSVKILDFDIAKPIDIMDSSIVGSYHKPTMVTPAVTEVGIMNTLIKDFIAKLSKRDGLVVKTSTTLTMIHGKYNHVMDTLKGLFIWSHETHGREYSSLSSFTATS